MDRDEITRVADDDPYRCQAVTNKGQCNKRALEGSNFCIMHNRVSNGEKRRVYELRRTQWQAQLEQHIGDPGIKSLRSEIGVLRLTLQNVLDNCSSSTELLTYSHHISDLVLKIERLVTSCHKLEGSMGELLDKQALLQFASAVLDILSTEIHDSALLATIGERIMTAVSETGGVAKSVE